MPRGFWSERVLAGALLVWPCVGSIYHQAGRRSTARSRYRASLRNPEGIETARSIERDNVRFGSLADIGEGYQGCPLYPPEADMLIVGIDVCYVPTSWRSATQGAMPPGVFTSCRDVAISRRRLRTSQQPERYSSKYRLAARSDGQLQKDTFDVGFHGLR